MIDEFNMVKEKKDYCKICKEHNIFELANYSDGYAKLRKKDTGNITDLLNDEYSNRCFVCGCVDRGFEPHTKEHIYDQSCFKDENKEMPICLHNLKLCCQNCNNRKNSLNIIKNADKRGLSIDFNAVYSYSAMEDNTGYFDFDRKLIIREREEEYLGIYENKSFWKSLLKVSKEQVFTEFVASIHEDFITMNNKQITLDAGIAICEGNFENFYNENLQSDEVKKMINNINIDLYLNCYKYDHIIIKRSIKNFLNEVKGAR